jgi:Caspase domain
LCQAGGLPAENVRLVLSSDVPSRSNNPWPLKHAIDDALTSIVPGRNARKGRRFYFYFSGHGCAPGFKDIALFMANAANDTLGFSLGADSYRNSLRAKAPFDEIVFILDCCRNVIEGAVPGVSPFTGGAPSNRAPSVKHLVCFGTGFGTQSWQVSGRTADESRGIFTETLLEGLNGQAADASGNVTAASLEDYVKPSVNAKAKKLGLEQIPEFDGSYRDIIFVKGARRTVVPVVIDVPRTWNGTMILRDGNLAMVEVPRPVARTWRISLSRGNYRLENLESKEKKLFSVEGDEKLTNGGAVHV